MDYSPELADAICELIASGESIRTICKAENMPAMSSIFKWLREHKDFSEQYARAKEEQAERLADELVEIADDISNDVSGELEMPNGVAVQRAKLRVDTRKWILSKLLAKKYGDKLDLNHAGEIGIKSILVPERIATERSATDITPDFGE
jgi:transposase-like protein